MSCNLDVWNFLMLIMHSFGWFFFSKKKQQKKQRKDRKVIKKLGYACATPPIILVKLMNW